MVYDAGYVSVVSFVRNQLGYNGVPWIIPQWKVQRAMDTYVG